MRRAQLQGNQRAERRWLALERMDNYYCSERGENSTNEGIGLKPLQRVKGVEWWSRQIDGACWDG
jgi:hypothetical protein